MATEQDLQTAVRAKGLQPVLAWYPYNATNDGRRCSDSESMTLVVSGVDAEGRSRVLANAGGLLRTSRGDRVPEAEMRAALVRTALEAVRACR